MFQENKIDYKIECPTNQKSLKLKMSQTHWTFTLVHQSGG